MKNKKLFIVVIAFVLIMVTGIAYAAIAGDLIFNGTVNLGGAAVVIDPRTVTADANGSSGTWATPTTKAATQSFTANIENKDGWAQFSYELANTGTVDVVIKKITVKFDFTSNNATTTDTKEYTAAENNRTYDMAGINLLFVGTDLIDLEVAKGQTTNEGLALKITWPATYGGDAGMVADDGKVITITITVHYEQKV